MGAFNNFLSKLGIFGELLSFLWKKKLWWLMPIVVLLVVLGLLLIFTQSSAVGSFIYTLF